MQMVFEKIIEKLEDKRKKVELLIMENPQDELDRIQTQTAEDFATAYKGAIEIVKQEAEQFGRDTNVGSNGWIPCSEKLPEVRQDVLVTVKYTGFMGMHGYWIKTGHMEAENDWWGDCAGGEVIAWMELPSAYRPKEK